MRGGRARVGLDLGEPRSCARFAPAEWTPRFQIRDRAKWDGMPAVSGGEGGPCGSRSPAESG